MADRSNDGIAPHNRTNIEQNMKRVLLTIAAVAALLSSCCNNGSNTGGWEEKDLLQIGDGIAIAETQYGKIQGFIYKDVYTFLGVPYGAPTGGANRFMPPVAPEKWEGIRPAVFWGNSAPQDVEGWYTNTVSTFLDHWNYFDISEDCLNLNVWTPGLDGKKRPVMVWFHGGGAKVCTVLAMESAKGLVNKAVALSGSATRARSCVSASLRSRTESSFQREAISSQTVMQRISLSSSASPTQSAQ